MYLNLACKELSFSTKIKLERIAGRIKEEYGLNCQVMRQSETDRVIGKPLIFMDILSPKKGKALYTISFEEWPDGVGGTILRWYHTSGIEQKLMDDYIKLEAEMPE